MNKENMVVSVSYKLYCLKELNLFSLIPDYIIYLFLQNYSAKIILISLFFKFGIKLIWVCSIHFFYSHCAPFKLFEFFGKLFFPS